MLFVETKYLRPTNTRGARIRASTGRPGHRAVTLGYDYARDFEGNCRAAAEECLRRNKVQGCLCKNPARMLNGSFLWVAYNS